MIISVEVKARIRKACKEIRSVMYIRCRLMGSRAVWCWLARIIRGRSQQVRTKRGAERGSVAAYKFREVQPVSDIFLSQVRLASAIVRLWRRVVGHSHLAGVIQAVGMSIMVGIKIFNIGGGLGFVGGQYRGYER